MPGHLAHGPDPPGRRCLRQGGGLPWMLVVCGGKTWRRIELGWNSGPYSGNGEWHGGRLIRRVADGLPRLSRQPPMNLDALLILQRSDIACYAAAQSAFGSTPLIFIDPGLTEEAVRAGIDPQLCRYQPLELDRHFQARVVAEASARAALLDQALTALRQSLFGAGVFQGWDEGVLYLFLVRALVARNLGQVCDQQIAEPAVGLLRPTAPQVYYFDSFLSTDLFAGHSRRWHVVGRYQASLVPDCTSQCWDFGRIAGLVREGRAEAITHIPTSFDQRTRYTEAIIARHRTNIDLPSPMWDIPVRRSGSMQMAHDLLPPDRVPPSARAYRQEALSLIEKHLAALVHSQEVLQQQALQMAGQCFVQALNHHGLLQALRGTKPHFILSDHDTGSMGPLFSVAAALDAPISVLPHSSYPSFRLPHALNVRAIERRGFGTRTRSVLDEAVATVGVTLGRPPQPVHRPAVRTVCLLVNTLYSHGLSYVDLAGLAHFYAAVSDACRRAGCRLLVRLKPSGAALMMAASAFELASEELQMVLQWPLDELADETDLCINYGEPTTAGMEFLCSASYLMVVGEQTWPNAHFSGMGLIAEGLVPCVDKVRALVDVEAMLSSPTEFRTRLQAQQAAFEARAEAPQPIFGP